MKRACNEEQIKERKDEIINVVNKMLDEMDYQDISMKTISERISIARSSLYCYYNSKEEIMLDILKNTYLEFLEELINSINEKNNLITNITNTYLNHIKLLKIISSYLTDIEIHCSLERLIEFKKNFVIPFENLRKALITSFPKVSNNTIDTVINSLLMLTHGLYPMICPNENQIKAMKEVHMNYVSDKYLYCYNYINFIFSKLM